MEIQVIAEKNRGGGVYEYIDTQYFSDPKSAKNWMFGAVEWADRLRIFADKSAEVFFEGIVVNKVISKWEKKDLKGTILNTIA